MRKILFSIISILTLASCGKDGSLDDAAASNGVGTKLKKIEFKNIQAPGNTAVWTFYYSSDKVSEILSNEGEKLTLEYIGSLLKKVNHYKNNTLISYQDLFYNNSNQLIEVTLEYRNSDSRPFTIEYRNTYQYSNGRIIRKDVFDDESTNYIGYLVFVYDNDGNIFEVKSYNSSDIYEGKYVYVSSLKENKLKQAISQFQVLAIFSERENDRFTDGDLHSENQYLNQRYIERETMIDANNNTIEVNNYQFVFNSAGMLTQKTDNTGYFIRYIYE